MSGSRLYVDFNELIDEDLVLLSQTDVTLDHQGNEVFLYPGKHVDIYMDDIDDNGIVDCLIASGAVEFNDSGLYPICKWNCRSGTSLQCLRHPESSDPVPRSEW